MILLLYFWNASWLLKKIVWYFSFNAFLLLVVIRHLLYLFSFSANIGWNIQKAAHRGNETVVQSFMSKQLRGTRHIFIYTDQTYQNQMIHKSKIYFKYGAKMCYFQMFWYTEKCYVTILIYNWWSFASNNIDNMCNAYYNELMISTAHFYLWTEWKWNSKKLFYIDHSFLYTGDLKNTQAW